MGVQDWLPSGAEGGGSLMPVKVKISYTPDEEAKITRLEALLKSLLPRHKVKKSTGTPPYNHLYFTPTKSENHTK